jgi:hypothetical protein
MTAPSLSSIYGHPWYWWLAVIIVIGAMLYLGKELGEAIADKA